jgi:nicotinamide riboside kinase
MNMIRKIAITGPESTGKSWLTERLAEHYRTLWVPEFARSYIGQLDRSYCEHDILVIARGQLDLERNAEEALEKDRCKSGLTGHDPYLFCDTELLVTKIWSEVKYGRCDPWILEQLENRSYNLYLLCYIDTPWEEDPQREHPQMRDKLYNLYYTEMRERKWNFRVVNGLGETRLQNAIKCIEACFTS